MKINESNVRRAEAAIYDALVRSKRAKMLGLTTTKAAEMSSESVRWSRQWYEITDLVGEPLRRAVRIQFKDKYGSLWTIVLFTIIWELIKEYLFESAR